MDCVRTNRDASNIMEIETLENIYDDETQTVELEGEFGLDELEEIVKFLREKE